MEPSGPPGLVDVTLMEAFDVIKTLGGLDDEQAHVIKQMLPSNAFTKASQDGLADPVGRLPVAGLDRLGESFDAVGDAGAIHRLSDAIGVNDHDIAGPQRNPGFADEAGNVLLQPQWKTKVEGVVPFEQAIAADDKNLFVLTTDGNEFVLIVKEAKSEVAIAIHATNVFVDHLVENLEELSAFIMSTSQKCSNRGLDHNGDYSAFETVSGNITNSEDDTPVFRDDVVVVPANFSRRFHRAGDVEVGNPAQLRVASAVLHSD